MLCKGQPWAVGEGEQLPAPIYLGVSAWLNGCQAWQLHLLQELMLQDLSGLSDSPDLIFHSVPDFHFGGNGMNVSHRWNILGFHINALYPRAADFVVVDVHPINQPCNEGLHLNTYINFLKNYCGAIRFNFCMSEVHPIIKRKTKHLQLISRKNTPN